MDIFFATLYMENHLAIFEICCDKSFLSLFSRHFIKKLGKIEKKLKKGVDNTPILAYNTNINKNKNEKHTEAVLSATGRNEDIMNYYAGECRYGTNVSYECGEWKFYAFSSAAERDAWVDCGEKREFISRKIIDKVFGKRDLFYFSKNNNPEWSEPNLIHCLQYLCWVEAPKNSIII